MESSGPSLDKGKIKNSKKEEEEEEKEQKEEKKRRKVGIKQNRKGDQDDLIFLFVFWQRSSIKSYPRLRIEDGTKLPLEQKLAGRKECQP